MQSLLAILQARRQDLQILAEAQFALLEAREEREQALQAARGEARLEMQGDRDLEVRLHRESLSVGVGIAAVTSATASASSAAANLTASPTRLGSRSAFGAGTPSSPTKGETTMEEISKAVSARNDAVQRAEAAERGEVAARVGRRVR